jgi:hypothetical protein
MGRFLTEEISHALIGLYDHAISLLYWPKTLGDFGLQEARFPAISGCSIRLAAEDRFRPGQNVFYSKGI